MKRLLLIQLFSLLSIMGYAQKLSVESFALKANDLSARTQPRQDGNHVDCALVKVQLASSGATFAGNVVGDVKYDTSEYWVYMAQGSKRLTIKLDGYLPLEVNFEDFEVRVLESKSVYVMIVSGIAATQPIEAPRIKTGWIILDSEPNGASVFINDEFVGNTPLTNYKQAYGTYSYRVERPNYHPSTGTLELSSGKLEKRIELKPAFGSISVTSSVAGAIILLDGKATNKTTPCTLEEVSSGQHTITLQKDKYSPCQQSVSVEDGQTTQLAITMDARFAQVSITSLQGAQIYCNGKLTGTTKHVEDMMEGYYDIEVRLAHHKSATKQIQVIAGQAQEITINPTPIYGSLDITSTPHEADVTIDEKPYGKTPLTIETLLEGEHKVVISKNGYASETHVLKIEENKETIVNAELKEKKNVISLKEGETLQSKMNEISTSVIDIKIESDVGLSEQDWECLKKICNDRNIERVDLSRTKNMYSIPIYAFYYCTGLTSITIPNSVTSIGNDAFEECTGLTSITIPNSVTSIGSFAFVNCTGLTSITIPNSVTSIGEAVFYKCTGLTSVTIPNSVTSIGNDAFLDCIGLTSITIPNSVMSIGNYAFSGCTGLTSVTIPNSVTSIGSYAFSGCTSLTSVTIPNSVTSIGEAVFYKCTGLTSVTIPNSVTSIGNYAFANCTGLKSIFIPDSITEIKRCAFRNSGLTSISIPNKTIVEANAFEGCPNLKITRR